MNISLQLKSKIQKQTGATSAGSTAADAETIQEQSEEEDEDDNNIPEGSAEQPDPHAEEEEPIINPPKPRGVGAIPKTPKTSKVHPTTSTSTARTVRPTGAAVIDQNLLDILAGRAVDSDLLKRRFESVLAEGDRPFHSEKLHWGQWLAACTNQVQEGDWNDFTKVTHDMMRRFVKHHPVGVAVAPPQCPAQPPPGPLPRRDPPAPQVGPSVQTSKQSTPTGGIYQQVSYGQSQSTGQSFGSQSYSGLGQSGFAGAGQSSFAGSGQSGFGGAGPSGYGQSGYAQSAHDQSYASQTAGSGNLFDISTPCVSSLDSSAAFQPTYSPTTFISDSLTMLQSVDGGGGGVTGDSNASSCTKQN